MSRVFARSAIESVLPQLDLVALAERAFLAYSAGQSVVPPVGELLFEQPPGEVHIKYGYIRGEAQYVIKIASGFYENPALGLPANNGLVLLFDQHSGELGAVLLDEGVLTDHRTAAAGACAARTLAPSSVSRVGILGTGTQAELQLRYLAHVTACREALVWGRRAEGVEAFKERLADSGFKIESADSPAEVVACCELVVTTTPSREPLLESLPPGRHVTAVGSDTAGKQELAPNILRDADLVVVDSIAQSRERGEVFRASQSGSFDVAGVVELGHVLAGDRPGRTADTQTTVADLTGVATQDLTLANAVFKHLAVNGPDH